MTIIIIIIVTIFYFHLEPYDYRCTIHHKWRKCINSENWIKQTEYTVTKNKDLVIYTCI